MFGGVAKTTVTKQLSTEIVILQLGTALITIGPAVFLISSNYSLGIQEVAARPLCLVSLSIMINSVFQLNHKKWP